MKKLEKLDSQDMSIMNHREMKNILGGYYANLITNVSKNGGSPKIDACKGKEYGAACSWSYEGKTYYGKCCGSVFGQQVHCTDLNCYK